MTVTPRLIPILQIQGSAAIKTTSFRRPRYIGSAVNSIRMFSELEVDELVVIDLSEESERDSTRHLAFLESFCAEGFMPLTYGGRVSSAERAVELARIGFEKVIVGTASFETPTLFGTIADRLGSQAVVAAVDVWRERDRWEIRSHSGRRPVRSTLEARLEELAKQPIGEMLLTSIRREGLRCGLDLDLISRVSARREVPLIVSGGTASISDCVAALHAGASAVAVGDSAVCLDEPSGTLVHLLVESDRVRWMEEVDLLPP